MIGSFVYAGFILVGAFFSKAHYGHFGAGTWVGWFLMKLPATVSVVLCFEHGHSATHMVSMILVGIWLLHYTNRGYLFPLLVRVASGARGTFGLLVVVAGWMVIYLHGNLNALNISQLSSPSLPETP